MSTTAAILQDLLTALRSSGKFASITLGDAGSDTSVPRASLWFEGLEIFPSDDDASARWVRLRAHVTVHTRNDKPAEAILRAVDLCALAGAALMADPHRTARCQDLPIGQATEIGRSELAGGSRRPEIEMSFAVRCHFQEAVQ